MAEYELDVEMLRYEEEERRAAEMLVVAGLIMIGLLAGLVCLWRLL